MKKVSALFAACLVAWAPVFAENAPAGVPPLRYPKPIEIEYVKHFSHSLEAVRSLFVDEVSDKELLENAISGMLTGLDPHSSYLNERDFKSLNIATEGEFSGLGIEVTMEHGVIRVISPIDDTPAFEAGIKPGDLIIRIDGNPIKGMTLNEAVNKMRGKRGTPVKLTIIRKGETKPLEKTIIRDQIKLESVKSHIIDERFGYIRVSNFGAKTGSAVEAAVKSLQAEAKPALAGIVLDLRNNPGGLLHAAVDVSDVFLDANKLAYDKKVVFTKGRMPHVNFEGKAKTPDMTHGVPVVVLINMGSASASEIVAAALQDHHRAIIMGVRSFGKGSVQTVLPLEGGKTAIKLTTARYYTPAGHAIQAEGVTPDVKVKELEVPESANKGDDDSLFYMREDSYSNRLHAEDESGKNLDEQDDIALMNELADDDPDKKDKKDLVYRDFQLYEAVNLLKGLTVASARGHSPRPVK